MLLPEYVGIEDPAAPVRARCVDAVHTSLGADAAAPEVVAIVTGRDREPRTSKAPLGARIGELLLGTSGWTGPVEHVAVPFDADAQTLADSGRALAARAERVLLLVVADGSARRSEKAPGHLDERAFGVDEQLLAALRDVDPEGLLAVDAGLAADVLATGCAALQVMAHAVRGTSGLEGGLLWSDDPYGVMYAVAAWTRTA
jgi:hypothetical protein